MRTDPADKTEGYLLVGTTVIRDAQFSADPDGRLRSRRIKAGSRPAAGLGLIHPTRRARIMDHVEPHAAAIMRRPGGPRQTILVINNPPCYEPGWPLMCEPLLPGILPRGSTLNVYVSDGNGTRFHKTYTGTGAEIE